MDWIQTIELWDKKATLAINSLNSPLSDQIWMFFSDRLVWIPLYLLVIVLLIRKYGWINGLIAVLSVALCILCVDQLCNLVKNSVARLRPCNDPDIVSQGLHMLAGASARHPYGFFSAHAGNAMAFATAGAVLLYNRENGLPLKTALLWRIILPVWAILVGISRIFVGKHFLGDVLVGFTIGDWLGYIFARLSLWLMSARASKSSGTTV